jgi:hypothetical protein
MQCACLAGLTTEKLWHKRVVIESFEQVGFRSAFAMVITEYKRIGRAENGPSSELGRRLGNCKRRSVANSVDFFHGDNTLHSQLMIIYVQDKCFSLPCVIP